MLGCCRKWSGYSDKVNPLLVMDYLLSANAPGDLCTLMLFCRQDAHITKLHVRPRCTRRRVAVRGTVLLRRTAALDTGVKYWMNFTLPAFWKVARPLKSNGNKRICHFRSDFDLWRGSNDATLAKLCESKKWACVLWASQFVSCSPTHRARR